MDSKLVGRCAAAVPRSQFSARWLYKNQSSPSILSVNALSLSDAFLVSKVN